MGYDPLSIASEHYTSPSVIEEIYANTILRTRLELALETGKVKVYASPSTILEEIEETARKVGDSRVLSKADKEVLAAALALSRDNFSVTLVSDDYAVQNVAEFFGLKYTSLSTFGIRYRFRWVLYCPACKRRYPADVSEIVCKFCGTKLKRKVIKKKAVNMK